MSRSTSSGRNSISLPPSTAVRRGGRGGAAVGVGLQEGYSAARNYAVHASHGAVVKGATASSRSVAEVLRQRFRLAVATEGGQQQQHSQAQRRPSAGSKAGRGKVSGGCKEQTNIHRDGLMREDSAQTPCGLQKPTCHCIYWDSRTLSRVGNYKPGQESGKTSTTTYSKH